MHKITDTLPPFWWLNPWGLCRSLHTAVRAMQRLAQQDDQENTRLREAARYYEVENDVNHDRWLRTLEENETLRRRVHELETGLDRLHAAIITGGAIVPDAKPEDASHE